MYQQKKLVESVMENLAFALHMKADDTFFESLYSTLINSVLDIITVHSLDAKYLFITPNSLQHFGYTQEEMIGKTPFDFIVPADAPRVYQVYQKLLKGEQDSLTVSFQHQTKRGDTRVIESLATIVKAPSGEKTGFLISSRDITEVWTKDQIIKDNEERYRSLVDNTDTLITTFDKHLNYLFVNPRAAAFWGLQPVELIGKNWRQMAPTDEKFQEYEQHITHVFSTREKVVLHEVKVHAHDAKPRWFTMSFVPIVGDDNTVKQVMVSATEITNSVLDREKIQLQTSELKEIAFIQSHMVRSPLANIQGLLQLIQDTCTDKETNKEQIEMLQLVQHEAKKLDKLLLDIVQKSYQLRQADNL